VEQAREERLERLRAVVLLANTPLLRLLQHYGWALADPTEDFSVAFLEISTAGGCPVGLRAVRVGNEPDCTAVLAVHRRHWPHRVAE
jgi:hypothetical protein